MKIEFHPLARRELREANSWYRQRSPLAASTFVQEIAAAVDRIAEAPRRYPRAEAGTRRFVLDRFPYTVVYRDSDTVITIVAVAHQKRRPAYWEDR